ncbi:MAG TPA: tetratricopeptide repeat protein [Pyrinomonadaceae bacterium]
MSRFIRTSLIAAIVLAAVCQFVLTDSRASASRLVTSTRLQGKSTIMGIVFDSSGRPLEKVRVELLDDVYTVLKTVRTSGSGQYIFNSLSSGYFQIRVKDETGEYAEEMQRVELVSIQMSPTDQGSRDIRQVDFYLRPKNDRRVAAGSGVVFAQNVPDDAKKSYAKAISDLEKNNSDEGVAALRAALQIFPDYYQALIRLGEEEINRARFAEASDLLARALKVNPKGYEAFYWLGIAQVGLKQMPEAVESFRSALAQNPSSVNSVMWLGMALRRSGKLDEAEALLKRAKQLASKPIPQAHWELALLYNHQKRNKQAADELELFLKAQPNSRDAEAIKKLIKQLREKAKP